MGTNCAPYLANLFLHTYETMYIDYLINSNSSDIAITLANMFRYQDDCIIFNDNGYFSRIWNEIYPIEMQLEPTSKDNVCTFLDLSICIVNGILVYKSYDKRNNFNFDIINYPNLIGNVPRGPSYGVFSSQLIRFCDINSQLEEFQDDIRTLVQKLIKQNFIPATLKTKFLQFYAKNIIRWSKFGSDILMFADFIS